MRRIITALLTFLCCSSVVLAQPATAPGVTTEDVKSINDYGNKVEYYANSHLESNRYFANVARQGNPRWREFLKQPKLTNPPRYFQQVDVSTQNGRAVYIYSFNYGINSNGRWDEVISYIFRNDGTLARAWSARIVRKENKPWLLVVQKWFYNSRGHNIRTIREVLDSTVGMGKTKQLPEAKFEEVPVPIYKSVSALPFHTLLKKPRPKP